MAIKKYNRGEIYWHVNPAHTKEDYEKEGVNHEFLDTRPVLILSTYMDKYGSTVYGIPTTTSKNRAGIDIVMSGTGSEEIEAKLMPTKMWPIPVRHLKGYIGRIDEDTLNEVYESLLYHIGLSDKVPYYVKEELDGLKNPNLPKPPKIVKSEISDDAKETISKKTVTKKDGKKTYKEEIDFFDKYLEHSPGSCITSIEVQEAYNKYARENGYKEYSRNMILFIHKYHPEITVKRKVHHEIRKTPINTYLDLRLKIVEEPKPILEEESSEVVVKVEEPKKEETAIPVKKPKKNKKKNHDKHSLFFYKFKGLIGWDQMDTELPKNPNVGDFYKITTGGIYEGMECYTDDILVCSSVKPVTWTKLYGDNKPKIIDFPIFDYNSSYMKEARKIVGGGVLKREDINNYIFSMIKCQRQIFNMYLSLTIIEKYRIICGYINNVIDSKKINIQNKDIRTLGTIAAAYFVISQNVLIQELASHKCEISKFDITQKIVFLTIRDEELKKCIKKQSVIAMYKNKFRKEFMGNVV